MSQLKEVITMYFTEYKNTSHETTCQQGCSTSEVLYFAYVCILIIFLLQKKNIPTAFTHMARVTRQIWLNPKYLKEGITSNKHT